MKKLNYNILIITLIFFIISVLLLKFNNILPTYLTNLYIKQIIWYLIGFVLIFVIISINNKNLTKYVNILYIIGNVILLLLLIFGNKINNSKCWIEIPYIGNFQPSEFMKIIIILFNAKEIDLFFKRHKNPTIKDEGLFLLKYLFFLSIPSILTFLEPDTGLVIIYIIISLTMLFISGIRYKWFIFGILLLILGLALINFLYNFNLLNIDDKLLLRINRIISWSNTSGYQLNNSMLAIGSSGILGHGIKNVPIYIPESQTDFIFSIYASEFGFIGSFFLLLLIFIFDYEIIKVALNNKKNINKYIIAGIISMIIYSQFQNIGMTFNILPITGITLPFISYGGSSIISYMLALGLVLNISKK